jgi:hypothetical protein
MNATTRAAPAGAPALPEEGRHMASWMANLCDKAREWIRKNSKPGSVSALCIPTTSAYADLIFAFGLARLGEVDASRALADRAKGVLADKDEVHSVLYRAYRHRIEEAVAGRPHAGPLSEDVRQSLQRLDKMNCFIVDRLRQHSRILEPDQKVDPYRIWAAKSGGLEKALAQIHDSQDRKEIASRFEKLLAEETKGPRANEIKARILRVALDIAPRVGEAFALGILGQVTTTYDTLPHAREPVEVWYKAALLEKGMVVAARFDRPEHIQALVHRFQRMLSSPPEPGRAHVLDRLTSQCFRSLHKLGMRDEIDLLLTQMTALLLESQGVEHTTALVEWACKDGPHLKDAVRLAALRALVHVASGWFYLGQDKEAEPVLEAARILLFRACLKPQEQTLLACTYVQTVGQAPGELVQRRTEELFEKLDGVRDSLTTNSHYALLQLNVIEAVVLALIDRFPEPDALIVG